MARRFTEVFPRLAELMPLQPLPNPEARQIERVRSMLRAMGLGCFLFIFQYWRIGLMEVACALRWRRLRLCWTTRDLGASRSAEHHRRDRRGATLLLLIVSNVYTGGFYDPNFSWFLVVPVGTAVVLGTGSRSAGPLRPSWSHLSSDLARSRHRSSEPHSEGERALHALANQGSAIIAIGGLVWTFVRSHARAETRALAAQKALLKERERLRVLAHFDSLTTLPNRNTFEQSLARCLADARPVALVYVDIDRFKDVNDAFGYALGDALLIAVAGRFANVVYDGPAPIYAALERYDEGPLLARRGGDEFVVLLPEASGAEAAKMAQRLVRSLRSPSRSTAIACMWRRVLASRLGQPMAQTSRAWCAARTSLSPA